MFFNSLHFRNTEMLSKHLSTLLFLCLSICWTIGAKNSEIADQLLKQGKKGNPGITTKLTPSGTRYLSGVAVRVLNREARKINVRSHVLL